MKEKLVALALPALLAVALVWLAWLQIHWISEMSAAAEVRLSRSMEESSRRLADDFDRELSRLAFLFVRPTGLETPRDALLGPLDRFADLSLYPELVAEAVGFVEGRPTVRLARDSEQRLQEEAPRPLVPPRVVSRSPVAIRRSPEDQLELLVRPVTAELPDSGLDLVLLRIDGQALSELFRDLVEQHFGDPRGGDFRVELVADSTSEAPGDVLLSSRPPPDGREVPPDHTRPVLRLRPFPEFADFLSDRGARRRMGRGRRGLAGGDLGGGFQRRNEERLERLGLPSEARTGAWQLRVTHHNGSLESAIERSRAQNLAMSLGILLLLGVSSLLVLRNTRRLRRAAQRELDFVAGITHELHTPLAAISSAAQNLSAGVTTRPERVREYGALVERESQRLKALVDQTLEYAGMQSRQDPFVRAPCVLLDVVNAAIRDQSWQIEQKALELEIRVQPGAEHLQVNADPGALQRAIGNLLQNAVKYSEPKRPIDIVLARSGSRAELVITDRGPGIEAHEQERIFEPFYRGESAKRGTTPGSGLGLNLARHVIRKHGGEISLDSKVGEGTSFLVSLPCLPPT